MAASLVALGSVGPGLADEHPRLLLSRGDVLAMRARAAQEPYASMVKAIPAATTPSGEEDVGTLYDNTGMDQAALYLMTGDAACAAASEKVALAMVEDKAFWNNPHSKGLTRAAGVRRVALSYDLCADAWPEATRKLVSSRLHSAADNLIRSMGAGANTSLANNWQAVRYAGAGLGYLASDEPDGLPKAARAYERLKAHLAANLGDNGWNPEGIGYTQYPWQFTGPFGIAACRAGLGDLRQQVPKAVLSLWTLFAGTVAAPGTRRAGLHPDLTDDNLNWTGDGTAALAFWYAPEAQKPAVRFMYDMLCGPAGSGTWDSEAAGGVYSLLYYPAGLQAANPARAVGLNYADRSHGVAIFRNQFRDGNDIVALVNGHSRQPYGCHGGSDTDTFRIIGLGACWVVGSGRTSDPSGQSNLFPGQPQAPRHHGGTGLGKLETVAFTADGGGSAVTSGSCVGVVNHRRVFGADFSRRSGAAAVFVSAETSDNGAVWRLNTPEYNRVSFSGNTFTLTAPHGATLTGTVLEPATPAFRLGSFTRGGSAGIPYRDKVYAGNTWLEFDCSHNVRVVFTLQAQGTPAPRVVVRDEAIHVGAATAQVRADGIVFGP